VTFEHRHKNKSCLACRDRVNERVKVVKVVKLVKLVKVVKVAKEAKVVKVFQNIPGSQLLSDIQTFFFVHSWNHILDRISCPTLF
jgi:hypothetical protein